VTQRDRVEVYDRLESTGTFGRSRSTVWKFPYIYIKRDTLRAASVDLAHVAVEILA
jgi:hypothetical protein